MNSGARLASMSMTELAEHIHSNATVKPGHRYATERTRPEKEYARGKVLSLFRTTLWKKGLSILTFPGLRWEFERQLLRMREGKRFVNGGRPRRTYITGIESDEAIFRASIQWIPGGSNLQSREPIAGGTASLRTPIIGRYHRCAFEDYASVAAPPLDAAWLDFNGPLTEARLVAIRTFWAARIRHYLIVTVGFARSSHEITRATLGAGSVHALLTDLTPGSEVVSVHSYADTTPMVQITLARRTPMAMP